MTFPEPPLIYGNHVHISKLNQAFVREVTKKEDVESTWEFISITEVDARQIEEYPVNQLKRYWQLLDLKWANGETYITKKMDVLELPHTLMKSAQASHLSVYEVVGILSADEMILEDIFTHERKNVSAKAGELHKPWSLLITRLLHNDGKWEVGQEIFSLSPAHMQLFRELQENIKMPNSQVSIEEWVRFMKDNGLELFKPFISSTVGFSPEDAPYHQKIEEQVLQLMSGKKSVRHYVKGRSPHKLEVLKMYDYIQWKEAIADRETPVQTDWTVQLEITGDFQYNQQVVDALRHEIELSTKIAEQDIAEMVNELNHAVDLGVAPPYLTKVISRIEKFGSLSIDDFEMLVDSVEEVRHYYEDIDEVGEFEDDFDNLDELDLFNEEVDPIEWPDHLEEPINTFLEESLANLTEETKEKYETNIEVLQMYLEDTFDFDQFKWELVTSQHFMELCSYWHIENSWIDSKSEKTQLLTVMKKFSQYLDSLDGKDRWAGWKDHYKSLKEQLITCLELESIAEEVYAIENMYDAYSSYENYDDLGEDYELFTITKLPHSTGKGIIKATMLSTQEEVEIKVEPPIIKYLVEGYSFEADYQRKGNKVAILDMVTFFPPLAQPYIKMQ